MHNNKTIIIASVWFPLYNSFVCVTRQCNNIMRILQVYNIAGVALQTLIVYKSVLKFLDWMDLISGVMP